MPAFVGITFLRQGLQGFFIFKIFFDNTVHEIDHRSHADSDEELVKIVIRSNFQELSMRPLARYHKGNIKYDERINELAKGESPRCASSAGERQKNPETDPQQMRPVSRQ
jgi:hypothetical protein